jgi:hypothetical protein
MRPVLPALLILLLAACGEGEPMKSPNAQLPDGGRYRGELVEGLLQGPGRIDYANGSYYEGNFKDGQFEGQGSWHGAGGETYVGEFHLGQYQGQGTFTYADGSHYEGLFDKGSMQGQGTLEQNGETWSGEFRDGELNGAGHYRGVHGEEYGGAFKDGDFHGQGSYSSDGDTWLGQFVSGQLSGQGEFRGADGSRYLGQFKDWQYDGEGRLQLADGSVYEGGFKQGAYDGPGVLTLADGSTRKGSWQAGQRIRDEQGKALPDPLDVGLLEQGRLLDQALAAIPASTPATELYGLTLAGDGKQSVFLREADYVADLLGKRFGARGMLTLANHRDHLADRPLATRESLARSLDALAKRSGPEDLLFIYLTSHGSADHRLSLDVPRLNLADLSASSLAELMRPLKDRYKVLVVSACYSGGFIPPLKDDKTLIITAARADRVSFGCSEEADFTYFGRALFGEALQQTDDLSKAFEIARARVAEREIAEDFEPSDPQIWAPKAVLDRWNRYRAAQNKAAPAKL